jgi:hypothetical protein
VATTDVEHRSRRKFGGIEIIARDKKLFTITEKNLLFEVAGWRLSASAINSSTNDHSVGPLNSNFSRTVATKAANSGWRWLELHIADSFSLKSNGMGGTYGAWL